MARRKSDLNTIYISERLQQCLQPIARCALTSVVAPMGYGKTTAVNYFLAARVKSEHAAVVRVSIYSSDLSIFWKSVQDAFSYAGLAFLREYDHPADAAGASLLTDAICHELMRLDVPCYVFLDDFHLLDDARAVGFLCALARRMPEHAHLIVASRSSFLPAEEIVRLGARLYRIEARQLRLTERELPVYVRRCGAALSDEQLSALLRSTEGWFSAVYLNLCTLSECGALAGSGSDIYALFSAAMIAPLPPEQQEFLAAMGLADEFTAEMAQFLTGNNDTPSLLARLTGHNAFVTRLPDGVHFRFHHMMKQCAEQTFLTLPPERQRSYHARYGRWYETHVQYLYALRAYERAGDYDAALRVIVNDAGILLASMKPEEALSFLSSCPPETLKRNPAAILVLMRRLFTWRQIPKMMELKALLSQAIDEQPGMTAEERGNLLGECDLIMSFLMYNDISKMSRLHRSASSQMSRPAVSIRNEGSWTFGSPSVLMMFHRTPGQLEMELAEMNDCMPHYYQITNNHGLGAEKIMDAEAAFARGQLEDAQILLARAAATVQDAGQENMALCCDFLARRLSMFTGAPLHQAPEQKRAELMAQHNLMWLNIFNSACAYCAALLPRTEDIPTPFIGHTLREVSYLAPCRPMMEMIENQVYLAQGEAAQVIGRSEALLGTCQAMGYALVALYVRIQTAAAYALLGRLAEAAAFLRQAVQDALPDGLVMPFAENYRYLEKIPAALWLDGADAFAAQIAALGQQLAARCAQALSGADAPSALAGLTGRESEIAGLLAAHLSNREIAERLYLSEGTVKQYLNQIYAKLQITGDTRTKRRRLIQLLQ